MRTIILLSIMLVVTVGCATHNDVKPTPIINAQNEIPEDQLLDVGIQIFDPGTDELESEAENSADEDEQYSEKTVFPQIRKAESRFIPYHLKTTLQNSGQWGAVRVVPSPTNAVDLLVKGEILESNGEKLIVRFIVTDASGRLWIDETYKAKATEKWYSNNLKGEKDAYQYVYNKIANDMLMKRTQLSPEEISNIRELAKLNFAAALTPEIYDVYLGTEKDGVRTINRLPSDDDPMMERVLQIREREYLLIDTVNEHYFTFYDAMWEPYENWRKFHQQEAKALREVRRKEYTRKILGVAAIAGAVALELLGQGGSIALVTGGLLAVQSGMTVGGEAEMHADAIHELDASFDSEIAPLVMEVDGRVVELNGSAETQFQQWQTLLREIYASETGYIPVNNGVLNVDIDHSTNLNTQGTVIPNAPTEISID